MYYSELFEKWAMENKIALTAINNSSSELSLCAFQPPLMLHHASHLLWARAIKDTPPWWEHHNFGLSLHYSWATSQLHINMWAPNSPRVWLAQISIPAWVPLGTTFSPFQLQPLIDFDRLSAAGLDAALVPPGCNKKAGVMHCI